MATEDRPRRPRERCYVIVSKETVREHAESVGIAELSDEILEALAEDVSYRVREVVQQSYELMRHAKRRKLTTTDFSNALQNADVQPLFGHGTKEPVTYQQTSNGEVFYVDDPEVDVVAMVRTEDNVPQLPSPSLSAEWLAIEGVPWSTAADQQSFSTQGKAGVARGIQSVSEDQLTYYEVVTKAILGSDSSVMKSALNDVQTSSRISPLLAYFINFVSTGVRTVSHDTSQLRCLLYTVKALVTNRFLFLQPKPYLSLLCEAITYCLLEPLAASIQPSSDHWILRDYTAFLLALTARRWNTELNKLEEDIKKQLAGVLSDASRPLCSLYGAVIGLFAFGLDAVREILLPALPAIIQRVTTALSDVNSVSRSDAQHVSSALLMCTEYLLRSARLTVSNKVSHPAVTSTDSASEAQSEIVKPEFYSLLYEFHGDALSVRLPAMYDSFFATQSDPQPSALIDVDPKSTQPGEQLLQHFLDPIPRRSDSDRGSVVLVRSERSSSVSSECADLGDMTVKETVSDPSRGIRLTILKKKPKTRADVDPPALSQAGNKDLQTAVQPPSVPAAATAVHSKTKELKKSPTKGISMQKVKVGLGDAFEDLVTSKRKQDIMFVFKFQGREQRCLPPLLPRWGIGGRSTVSWYQVLCRRLPRVAPRIRRKPTSSGTKRLRCTIAVLCTLDLAQTFI